MVFEYTWIYYYYWSHAPLTMSIFWRIFSTTFYHKKLSKYCVAFVRTGTRTLYGTICTKQNKSSYVPYITTYFHFSSFIILFLLSQCHDTAMTISTSSPVDSKNYIIHTNHKSCSLCDKENIQENVLYGTVYCAVLYDTWQVQVRYRTLWNITAQHSPNFLLLYLFTVIKNVRMQSILSKTKILVVRYRTWYQYRTIRYAYEGSYFF